MISSIGFDVYYGYLFGGDVIRTIFKDDDADFAYVEATTRL